MKSAGIFLAWVLLLYGTSHFVPPQGLNFEGTGIVVELETFGRINSISKSTAGARYWKRFHSDA
jgi:hypothetical protein